MQVIAHRGNLNGSDPDRENTVQYIERALGSGYDVEIDVWWEDDFIFRLGHDGPNEYEFVDEYFLEKNGVWCHAKNIDTFNRLLTNPNINCFYQTDDEFVSLTSKTKSLWINSQVSEETSVDNFYNSNSIYVHLGERLMFNSWRPIGNIKGVCTDYAEQYRDLRG